jgi:thiosulfate dehydrogenase
VETVAFRINECMERSLNGRALDSNSREVKAMEAYFQWLDYGVPKGVKPEGAGTQELHFLNRPADPIAGERVFAANCQRCHGTEGKGVLSANAGTYVYPPLWGSNSYNVSAGMYRLTKLAGFIKNNMPFGVTYKTPQLTDEEAWDVAAYICTQPRPATTFSYDWPKVTTKPIDYPFKPYADSFSEQQHKYGPFGPIAAARKKNKPVN